MKLICPRCKGTEFEEDDCGPDSFGDDITWTSYTCNKCKLRYAGWRDKWVINCNSWWDEDKAELFGGE